MSVNVSFACDALRDWKETLPLQLKEFTITSSPGGNWDFAASVEVWGTVFKRGGKSERFAEAFLQIQEWQAWLVCELLELRKKGILVARPPGR